jgi:prepilin-type N-terminal cleavage/methylation domain-containing protein
MFNHKPDEFNKTRNQGFTLIEVLIAVTLFAFGIIAVASLQATAINGNATAKRHSEAATLAVDQIEKLKRSGYPPNPGNETVVVPGGGTYDIAWTVSDGAIKDTKFVDVTVDWDDAGKAKSLSFRFLKALNIKDF